MIKEVVKRDFPHHQSLIIVKTREPINLSINQNEKPFRIQVWISEHELNQIISIQKAIKEEFGIEENISGIAGHELRMALNETMKTCVPMEGE
ncbi:hypothetical protein [Methanobacterium aggregans]|uniref:hypothetical protein n=1 Tax=Methanobacterium aggregans TaxID=1615586 RepID=UPI00320EFF06